MGPDFIPIRLTLAELCVAALMQAADDLNAARDHAAFLEALANNYCLWQALTEAGEKNRQVVLSPRDCEFVLRRSSCVGHSLSDADVETLCAINRRISRDIARNIDIPRVRARAELAHQEAHGDGFMTWLLGEAHRKIWMETHAPPNCEIGFSQRGSPRSASV
ncbi:MAG TPA: hypothetical protein HPQ04_04230 [Rhodospirillaceae bacterium]|jgi:hypothetical protein|nr:hypothetical protein [Rhodospirillaceae bacterium]